MAVITRISNRISEAAAKVVVNLSKSSSGIFRIPNLPLSLSDSPGKGVLSPFGASPFDLLDSPLRVEFYFL